MNTCSYSGEMTAAGSADRNQFVKTIKDNAAKIFTEEMKTVPLVGVEKQHRGFAHPDCRRLLAPLGLDLDDPRYALLCLRFIHPALSFFFSVVEAMVNGSKKYKPGPKDWTRLLWREGKVDITKPKTLNEGFLRVQSLVKVRRITPFIGYHLRHLNGLPR